MNFGRFKWGLAACGLAGSIILASCGGSSGNGDSTDRALTTTAQALSRYAQIAELVYSDSLADAQSLQVAVQGFLDNPTEENLDIAKAAYKVMRVAYQQ